MNTSNIAAGNIAQYQWDLGDGNTAVTTNVVHQYGTFGNYTVTLITQSDSLCYDTVQKIVSVHPVPTANFTYTNDCVYNVAQFQDSSVIAQGNVSVWYWNFGNGNYSNVQNPGHLYSSPGDYTVTLIVQSDSACYDTISKVITRYPSPVVNFSFFDRCVYDSVNFINLSTISNPDNISQWNWSFGDGNNSSLQNPTHLYAVYGDYTVSLIAISNHNCKDTLDKVVEIHPKPNADFVSDTVCINTPPTHFTDISNLSNFHNDNITGWMWNFNGLGFSSNQNPTFTFPADGTYTVSLIVYSSFNCFDTIVKNVRVYEKPTANFTANVLSACSPLCTNFQDLSLSNTSSIISWQWDLNNNEFSSNSSNPQWCLENSSNTAIKYYDVKLVVQNAYGCYDTLYRTNYLTVYPLPLADFEPLPSDTDIMNPNIVFLNQSIGGSNFVWNFGDNYPSLTVGNTSSVQHYYDNWGTYFVTLQVYNTYNCYAAVTKPVKIEPIITLFVPNAFTPTQDNLNDYFNIKGYGLVEDGFQMWIFDRWGEKIFYSNDLKKGWDGMVDGKPAKQDVYVYKIIVFDVLGKKHQRIGHVTLLRSDFDY